eukprot:1995468-Pyramimonas_sp.AAC.1
MAIKDGGWHAAQWLAPVPVDAEPCAASRQEETVARRVAHGELRREELRSKLQQKRASFWGLGRERSPEGARPP